MLFDFSTTANPALQNQPHQYSSLPLSAGHRDLHRNAIEMHANQIERTTNDIETDMSSALLPTQLPISNDCNYQQFNIARSMNFNGNNKVLRKDDIVFQTPQHGRLKRYYDRNNDKDNVVISTIETHEIDNTILPPPLFDEPSNLPVSEPILMPAPLPVQTQHLKSRRHHRTIPRHFTLAEPSLIAPIAIDQTTNNLKANGDQVTNKNQSNCSSSINNKKPVCQCPVQHVPMTYMGSSHLNSTRNQQNEMFLSTLNRKQGNHKTNVAKSASFSTMTSPSMTKTYNRESASGILSLSTNASATNSPNLTTTSHSQNSTLRRHKTPVKISTISKQIGNADGDSAMHGQKLAVNIYEHPIQMQLTPADKNHAIICDDTKARSSVNIMNNTEITGSPFPIQFIESMGKNKTNSNSSPKENGTNPILPPKLYKSAVPTTQNINAQTSSRIQTISKPLSDINFISPSNRNTALEPNSGHRKHRSHSTHRQRHSNGHVRNEHAKVVHSKSLPRNEDRNTLSAAKDNDTCLSSTSNYGKTNFSATSYPMLTNHYTLPKASSAKMTVNSTITDVVNKVPPIVNIPSPSNADQPASTMKTNSPTTAINKLLNNTNNSSKSANLNKSSKLNANINTDTSSNNTVQPKQNQKAIEEKQPLPVCTTYKNCSNPKEHFLPNDTSLDDDYLSECENCKSAHGSRYYLDEEVEEQPQETMTLQRKMDEKEDEQAYYRTSSTLPTNTKQKTT